MNPPAATPLELGLEIATGPPPSAGESPLDEHASRLVEEMIAAWGRGDRETAETYFARYPELCAHSEVAIRLLYEEVCLRRGEGEDVSLSELCRRFPGWRAELEVLLACDRLLESGPVAPVFPEAGETLGDFRLLTELGRGTRGRCFLATQPSLAHRLVVLKLTPDDHGEHLALASLQHTHIVPLYSEQEFPFRNLRALCMPYLGGATLAQVLALIADVSPDQRTGQSLLDALDRARAARPEAAGASPTRQFLARATYVRAICWVGACLADALQYAHDRGLVHMDVKPSNVLLAADGQPLLLDFHLACAPLRAGAAPPECLGGTPGYMSPEQELALAAVSGGQDVPTDVGARSDLYSLGQVLYEALGGTSPHAPNAAVRFHPGASVGLGDVVRKCLDHAPGARYPDAGTLAADLRRHMADLPLRGVANRSLSERCGKWCRRQPAAVLGMKTLIWSTAAAAIVAAVIWSTFIAPRFREAERALLDAKVLLSRHDYPGALRALTRGAALIERFPGGGSLSREFTDQFLRAHRERDAGHLHDLVERLRFLESAYPRPPQAAADVERQCRAAWVSRRSIVEQLGGELNPEAGLRLRADMLDLAVIGAGLRVRLTAGAEQTAAAQREALRVLEEAEAAFGPSPVLYIERQAHAEALGMSDVAESAARSASLSSPRTAWEHCAVGRSLLAASDLARAEDAFERALALRPEDFWSNYYQGVCAYRLRRYEGAVNAFRVCAALAPNRADCFYNLAHAHAALGHTARASLEHDRAARLASALTAPLPASGIADPPTGH